MNRGGTTRSRRPLTQEQRDARNRRRRELRALQSSANQLQPPALQTAFGTTQICLPTPIDNVAQKQTPTIQLSSARADRLRELNRARVRRSRERMRAEQRDAQNARRRQCRAQATTQAHKTDRHCSFQTGDGEQFDTVAKSSLTGVINESLDTTGVIDESLDTTSQALKQNNRPPNQEPSSHSGAPTDSKTPGVSQNKPHAHVNPSSIFPNPLVKAAAFAAGGRIATPSMAASLFKAAQSKNAVRIRNGGAAAFTGLSVTSATAAATLPSPASSSTAPITAAATLPSSASSSMAPITAVVCLQHAVNPRFPHLSASKLCDVQGCVGKAPCQWRPAILRRFAGR